MKQRSQKDIYQLASKEIINNNNYDEQVDGIISAYCKVQQIRRPSKNSINSKKINIGEQSQQSINKVSQHQGKLKKNNPASQYHKKIKETLKELTTNKTKEQELIIGKVQHIPINNKRKPRQQEEQRLRNAALKKMENILKASSNRIKFIAFAMIIQRGQQQIEYENAIIRTFKLGRVYKKWHQETILQKIQKERKKREQQQKLERAYQMANAFRQFVLLKHYMKYWKRFTIQSIKIKTKQEEDRKKQIQNRIANYLQEEGMGNAPVNHKKQEQQSQKSKQNSHLQKKLRGFLDNLKDKIQNKGRLATIKEKTEDSEVRKRLTEHSQHNPNNMQQQLNEQQSIINHINDQQQNAQQEQQNQDIEQNRNQIHAQQQDNPANRYSKKPLSNEQLQKRRKQLAHRQKCRKQALDKLRKEKQSKKKEEEKQRKQIQKQVELQQKRLKQQQYKQFLKRKQQEEEWQLKQIELIKRADQFNNYRIKKFYGILPWKKMKDGLLESANLLQNHIISVFRKSNGRIFLAQLQAQSQRVLQQKYDKMKKFHAKKKKIIIMKIILQNKIIEKERKKQLEIRHEYHTCKIVFKQWLKLFPVLRLQNIEYQRPRIKKADTLYRLTLMSKGMKALRDNKNEEQKNKNINEHKNLIKNKIQDWLKQDDNSINIDQFL